MTGRYPWGVGYYDMTGEEAVPLSFSMLPEVLKKHAGYETHAIGKWNLGDFTKDYTPTFRGFDSFLGYYAAAQADYWYHGSSHGCCAGNKRFCTDLSLSEGAMKADGVKGAPDALNGTYNSEIFTNRAVQLIKEHASRMAASQQGLYLYVPYQNVHATGGSTDKLDLQAPCEVIDKHYGNCPTDDYKAMGAMVTMLDFGIGNITAALDTVRHPYVLIFHSDNGGPTYDGGSNAPLRGSKHTFWEGGMRVRSFVTGPLIPKNRQGKEFTGLAHSSDWYLTIVEGIANASLSSAEIKSTGPRAPDGFNLWPALLSGSVTKFGGPREEVIHQVVNKYSKSGENLGHNSQIKGTKAPAAITRMHVRPGTNVTTQYKLVLGYPGPKEKNNNVVAFPDPLPHPVPFGKSGGARDMYLEEKSIKAGNCRAPGPDKSNPFLDPKAPDCQNGCLFDLLKDPSEKNNLIKQKSLEALVTNLKNRLNRAASTGPPWAVPLNEKLKKQLSQEICRAEAKTGYLEPVRTSAPSDDDTLLV